MRFIFFMLDDIFKKIKHKNNNHLEKFCVIWDREDYDKEKNFAQNLADIGRLYRETIADNLFDIINKIYFCNVNVLNRMMFAVAKVFIPKKYVEIIEVMGDPSGLLQHFDPDCLLKEFGGMSELNEYEDEF